MLDKKSQLITTALRLFYANGINGVGINEILKISGVAKKTLYSYFASKDELVLATLHYRDAIFIDWLRSELQPSQSDSEVIYNLFTALGKWFRNDVPELSDFRGCYFINTSGQCTDMQGTLFDYCVTHKQKIRALIKQYLPHQDDSVIDAICLIKEGAIVSAYLYQDPDAAQRCIPIALTWLTP